MNILEVDNLTIAYKDKDKDFVAVKEANFHLKSGEILGIAGGSGSGKSTLAKGLIGLLPRGTKYLSGEIRYKKEKVELTNGKGFSILQGKEISMVFQDPTSALNPIRKIKKQFYDILGRKDYSDEKVRELLSKVHLKDVDIVMDKYPFELSGGMKQRVVMAMAICKNARLLIADEPTSALDASVRKEIIDELRNIKEENNLSIILISHNLADLKELCDRIIVMNNGEMIEEGTRSEILENPKNNYTKKLVELI